jgi:hypothetical protein
VRLEKLAAVCISSFEKNRPLRFELKFLLPFPFAMAADTF